MTTGTIIGRRRVRSLTNRPAARRTWRWSDSMSIGLLLDRVGDRVADLVGALVEQVLGLRGVHPPAGDDLGPGDDRSGRHVDRHDHDDHALLGQHPAVAQHALGRRRRRCRRRRGSRRARPAPAARTPSSVSTSWSPSSHTSTRSPGTPIDAASRACRVRWRYSPWTGVNHAGVGDRQQRLELLLLGVAGHVHVGDARVHDLGAQPEQPVDHPASRCPRCPGWDASSG